MAGIEKTLAMHAIAFAFEQGDLLCQMNGKTVTRGLAATETVNVITEQSAISVESTPSDQPVRGVYSLEQ